MPYPPAPRWSSLLLASSLLGAVGCTLPRYLADGAREPVPFYLGTNDTEYEGGIFAGGLHAGGLAGWARVGEATQPTFLAWGPQRSTLLAVEELPEGRVASFSTGNPTRAGRRDSLLRLSTRATGGGAPCHVAVSGESLVAVSNYAGGNLALLHLGPDGALSERLDLHDHRLAPTNTAHAHSAYFVGGGEELIAADLGVDAIFRYGLGGDTLAPLPQTTVALPPGTGPRHIAVAPDGDRYYVVNEYGSSVTLVEGLGTATHRVVETVSTLPPERVDAENYPSHVALSDDGRWLYVANRGDNSLAVFRVNGRTGQLRLRQAVPVGGDWPRHFAISPGGGYLVVANQRSNNVVLFRRSRRAGKLTLSDRVVAPVPQPMCVLF